MLPSESVQVDFEFTNDGLVAAGGDGIDIAAVALGAANGAVKITNNNLMGTEATSIGGNGIRILSGGLSGSVGVEVDNTKNALIKAAGDGMNIAVTGDVDVTNDGAIKAGGGGIQVLTTGNATMTGAEGTIEAVDEGVEMITLDGDVEIINPGKVTVTNGSGVVGATSNGKTTITTNKTVTVANGNGVYGASINGDTVVTTNDLVSVTNGTYGAAANAINGNALLTISGGIDPPSIGGSSTAVNGNAVIVVNNDVDFDVEANDVGLLGTNIGSGAILITNNGETIDSGGAGVIAAKLGAAVDPVTTDPLADSIVIKNLGGRIEADGVGISVTAADPNSIINPAIAVANNVRIINDEDINGSRLYHGQWRPAFPRSRRTHRWRS